MAGELPEDIKATLSILDSQTPPPPASLKTTRTMEDIALPTKRQPTGGDDVSQTLAILDGKEPEPVATAGEPDPRDIEVDVLKLALRKGINSNTALAAHRQSVARKLSISPALVTPQAEESAFYQEHDPEDLHKNYPALAKYLKVEGNAELVGKNIEPMKELEVFFRRAVQDPEIVAAKGVVGAVQTLVGLGNLVSAGKAGKYVEEHGIDLKKIQSVLNDLYSPEAQAALKSVEEAEGFLGTLTAALKNPSSIGLFVGESLPQMYLGRVFGSGLKAAFPGLSFGAAGAAGEGITMAGGSAEQIRSATEDGELTAGQAALSVGVGVAGTALSAFGAKLATKLGIEDVDAALVAGKLLSRLEDSGVPKQLAVRLVGGAVVEGAVEEMPQSVVEQIAQNVALGRAWDEGVPESAAIGLVTGGAMGAAVQVGAVRGKQPTVTETPAEKQARTTVQNSIMKTAAAVNAEEQRNAIKEWGQRVASNNPLRKEAPDSFKEFVRTMAEEDGALKEVYVDGKLLRESLAQAGIDEDKLKTTMPDVAESLGEALATNGEARIPIEDYAAHIVGTPVEQAILDHLRTTPEGMTYAEAQVYFQEQQDDFIKQAEALVSLNEPVLSRKEFEAQAPEGVKYKDYLAAHKNKVEVFAKDLETVHDKLLEGLDSTGRFHKSITRVYAIPFREFYATNAARMGVLPTELYDSLPLNFQQMSVGDMLNQAPEYRGHLVNSGGLQGHSVGELYPYVLVGRQKGYQLMNGTTGEYYPVREDAASAINDRPVGKAELKDFNQKNVKGVMRKTGWMIMSAWNPNNTVQSREANDAAHEKLLAELKTLGLEHEVVMGRYGSDEEESPSVLILGVDYKTQLRLARDYQQESVLVNRGLLYQDGSINPPDSTVQVFKSGENALKKTGAYTRVPSTGTIFSMDFDFSGKNNYTPEVPRSYYQSKAAQPDSLTLTGVHYSKEQRSRLEGKYFGTGLPGAERDRLSAATDKRILNRVDFYADIGDGVVPESGLGNIRHEVPLSNIYDASKNERGFRVPSTWTGMNDFESQVIDAGYDGYFVEQRTGNKKQGRVVVLGDAAGSIPIGGGTLAQSANIPPTINIDGIERPTINSEGKPIYPTEEGIRNFWRWFGDSKVVDEQGRPLVVYHGTAADFSEFSTDFMYAGEGASQSGSGFYFTTDRESGSNYALMVQEKRDRAGGNVSPVYLALNKPLSIDFMKGEVSGAEINLTRARVKKIIMAVPGIRDVDGPLSNYGDVEYEGFNRVLNEAIDQYAGGNNIAALRNDFYGDDHGAWLRALKAATGFDSAKSVTPSGATHFIAWDPNQIKSAIGNTGEFSDDPNILKQSAFYSALQREIPSISKIADKNGMVKTDQAIAWIEARQKEGRFKLEEVEAVGLKDWLQATEGKVSVTDIDTFVRENGVQIEETLLGEPSNELNSEPAFYEYDEDNEQYAVYSYQIDSTEYYDSESEAADRVEELNADVPSGETKFESYALPGGTNYRELLLTLPGKEGQAFKSAHFDQPNILAHIRVDERTVGDQRVLFVEEIQSDWAQQGRDKGFVELTPQERNELKALDKRAKELGDKRAGLPEEAQEERIAINLELLEVNKLREKLREKVRGGVPTGPFVQNTKSWTALAVKRLLRYAAENGFDKIAWTTGEQQAARYDLSKQIAAVNYVHYPESDSYGLHFETIGSDRGIADRAVKSSDLPDFVGKELAEKIVNGEGAARKTELDNGDVITTKRLSGLDLKIGGEGMKAFYDQIVPQVVNEVSKKLGGGKVGTVDFRGQEETFDQYLQRINVYLNPEDGKLYSSPEYRVGDRIHDSLDRIRRDFETKIGLKKTEAGLSEQQSLEITPEMREKILSGLPLFQGQRAGFDPSTFTISLLKGADLSSVIHEGAHFYLEALADLAGRDNAPQQIKDDFRTTLNWFGITGNEEGTPGGDLLEQKAFHGSPHDHDKFDKSKIGTGEGAQAYGYGHYFTDTKEVAEYYKEKLTEDRLVSINNASIYIVSGENVVQGTFEYADGSSRQSPWLDEKELSNLIGEKKSKKIFEDAANGEYLEDENLEVINTGKLYEVELAPEQDEYLLWDKPLSEQSDKVKTALRDYAALNPTSMIAEMVAPLEATATTGDSLYRAFVRQARKELGTEGKGVRDDAEKKASEMLHFLGIRGIKYLDGSSRAKGEGAYNYVVFSDEDITIVQKYDQGGETPPPGQLPSGKTPEEIWRSMTLDQKRPYHEQWAQSYERYTLEGKAPTVEMQSVFSRFREWMLSVYKSMKDFLAQNPLAGKLNDDIRGVFDRLIASEEKIYQAEEARGYTALFASAAEAGLSEAEYEDYVNLGKLASTRALDEMQGRSIRDMRWLSNAKDKTIKRLQAEAKNKRAAVMSQVTDEVDSMPLNRARNFLTKGEFIDEQGVRRESETKFKLNSAEVKALSNGQIPDAVKGMVSDDGVGLELAAKLLGYQNPEALLNDLVNGESRDVTIQGLTDQRMLEQYGDLIDDKAIERAAEKAIHNEARAKFVATGLKILAKTELSATQLNRAAKLAAEATIAKKKIRALTPGQFTRAEAKANREAIESVAKDPRKAVEAQRAALLNNRLAKAALEASEEVDSILKYFKKFESQGVRKAVGIDQIDQIDDLLQTVDRDKSLPLREIDKRQALAEWVAEQEADGFEPVLDPILAEQIKAKHYKEMTVDELRMLRDTVKQIEHVGRLKQTLLTEMRRADFRERVEEAEASIRDNANRTVKERGTPTDVAGITGQWVRQMIASHRKFSSYMREMDGGKDGGVMWRLLSKNMNAAGDQEIEMRRASGEAIAELFKGFKQEKAPLNLYAKRTQIPGTEIFMTQEQRIMFGMNWGNEGNRQRLLDGGITGKRALSITEAQAILDTLTKEEWDFIQGTWDHIATYKDQIAALERKLTGIEPEWIEPAEIKTKYGTYRGGYFPAKYDVELSSRSESLEAAVDLRMGMKGAFNTAATRNGYTKQRSEAVMNRPLLLSYNVIANHISEVTHRLAWQPWLIDANRILKALDAPIREHYGAEVLRELRNTVIDIAAGDIGARTPMERAINHLRTGSTIVGMGWRFSTAFLQPSGLAQSWARIGGRWMAKGIAESLKNLNKAGEFVNARSSLMKNRDITMNREVREVLDRIRTTESVNAVTGSYFSLIAKMQRMVDIPTWMGAYEKALNDLKYEDAADAEQREQIENDAVALADQAVVDSQSGGQIKDLASIQRGHPGLKLFTNFYSYFSATYNLNIEALRRTNFRSPTDVAFLASDLVLLNVLPVIFAVALKEMTKGKCGDDLECLAASYGYEQMGFMFGQMVLLRDAGSAALVAAGGDQFGYSGPAGLRFFSDLYKAGVQTNQGELDWPLFKSVSNTAGVLLHFPTGQINTTLEGIIAVENGDVDGVSILPALLFGPPKE